MSTTPSTDYVAMGSNFAAQSAIHHAVMDMLGNIPGADNPLVKIAIMTALPKLTAAMFIPLEKSYGIVTWLANFLFVTLIWNQIKKFYYWCRREPVQQKFVAIVAQMNDQRQPSELYDALLWYTSSRPKEEREAAAQLEYFVPKAQSNIVAVQSNNNANTPVPTKEEMEKKLLSTIPQSQQSAFFWKDPTAKDAKNGQVVVHFSREIEEVEVPGEKPGRKKPLHKIQLWRWHTQEVNDLNPWFHEMFAQILHFHGESKRNQTWKQRTFANRTDGQWDTYWNSNTRTLDTTILKSDQKELVMNVLAKFTDEDEINFDKKIGRPHKVTFLLTGPPGCGKTTLQQAVSGQLKRDLYYLNLSNVKSNEQLVQLMEKVDNANSVVVIEEIDVATIEVLNRELRDLARLELEQRLESGVKNPEASLAPSRRAADGGVSTLNLEGILNVLQGNVDADKRIMFITTNCPEKLDPAVVRPGRVDVNMVIDHCDLFQILQLFSLYYEDKGIEEQHLDRITSLFEEKRLSFDNLRVEHDERMLALGRRLAEADLQPSDKAQIEEDLKAPVPRFVPPTPCQVDSILALYRDDIERGIKEFQEFLNNPEREAFAPAKTKKQISK